MKSLPVSLAIKQSREERHVSRRELSRKTGLPLGKIIDLERGLGDPPLTTEFIRISCALRMNPEALDDRVNEFHRNMRGVPKGRCGERAAAYGKLLKLRDTDGFRKQFQ
jgi:hypothetical protein